MSENFVTGTGAPESNISLAELRSLWTAKTHSENFEEWLVQYAQQYWSIEEVQCRLRNPRRAKNAPSPKWLKWSLWFQSKVSNNSPSDSTDDRYVDIPFSDLFFQVAVELVRQAWKPAAEYKVDEQFYDTTFRWVISELSLLSAPALYTFGRSKGFFDQMEASKTDRTKYHKYCAFMRTSGWEVVFEDAPVLLRLIGTKIATINDTLLDLSNRLRSDILCVANFIDLPPLKITLSGAQYGLSDPHNGREPTILLFFNNEKALIYKDRNISVEDKWWKFVRRLNYINPPQKLLLPKCIDRTYYGWVEYVEHQECRNHQDVEIFYRRLGSWLALFTITQTSDMHFENIIANRSHPVPIDLETTFHAVEVSDFAPQGSKLGRQMLWDRIRRSNLNVGVLPVLADNPEDSDPGVFGQFQSVPQLEWSFVNFDRMKPCGWRKRSAKTTHLPKHQGQSLDGEEWRRTILEGFIEYSYFIFSEEGKNAALEFASETRNSITRIIVKDTRLYSSVLTKLKDFQNFYSGIRWGFEAQYLNRRFNPYDWRQCAIFNYERSWLVNLDIPVFYNRNGNIKLSSKDLNSGSRDERQWMVHLFERGIDEFLKFETTFISNTRDDVTRISGWNKDSFSFIDLHSFKEKRAVNSKYYTTTECLHILFEILRDQAWEFNSEIFWLGVQSNIDHAKNNIRPLGQQIYDGNLGVAIFLAAYGTKFCNDSALRLAYRSVREIESLGEIDVTAVSTFENGGLIGLSSMAYGMYVLGKILENERLIDRAAELFIWSFEEAGESPHLDLVSGLSGHILVGKRIFEERRNPIIASILTFLIDRLMVRVSRLIGAGSSLEGGERMKFSGLSHGPAGVALALAEAWSYKGIPELRRLCHSMIQRENSVFDFGKNNWPRQIGYSSSSDFVDRWCYGSTGIGLGRLGVLKTGAVTNASIRNDIQIALNNAVKSTTKLSASLCCGELGKIELLREASRAFYQKEIFDIAQRRCRLISTAICRGENVFQFGNSGNNFGLFLGAAGIGYTLLRMEGAEFPNIALLG